MQTDEEFVAIYTLYATQDGQSLECLTQFNMRLWIIFQLITSGLWVKAGDYCLDAAGAKCKGGLPLFQIEI